MTPEPRMPPRPTRQPFAGEADRNHDRRLARVDQVEGTTDADRDLAFANLREAAHCGVALVEARWQDLRRRPHTPNPARG